MSSILKTYMLNKPWLVIILFWLIIPFVVLIPSEKYFNNKYQHINNVTLIPTTHLMMCVKTIPIYQQMIHYGCRVWLPILTIKLFACMMTYKTKSYYQFFNQMHLMMAKEVKKESPGLAERDLHSRCDYKCLHFVEHYTLKKSIIDMTVVCVLSFWVIISSIQTEHLNLSCSDYIHIVNIIIWPLCCFYIANKMFKWGQIFILLQLAIHVSIKSMFGAPFFASFYRCYRDMQNTPPFIFDKMLQVVINAGHNNFVLKFNPEFDLRCYAFIRNEIFYYKLCPYLINICQFIIPTIIKLIDSVHNKQVQFAMWSFNCQVNSGTHAGWVEYCNSFAKFMFFVWVIGATVVMVSWYLVYSWCLYIGIACIKVVSFGSTPADVMFFSSISWGLGSFLWMLTLRNHFYMKNHFPFVVFNHLIFQIGTHAIGYACPNFNGQVMCGLVAHIATFIMLRCPIYESAVVTFISFNKKKVRPFRTYHMHQWCVKYWLMSINNVLIKSILFNHLQHNHAICNIIMMYTRTSIEKKPIDCNAMLILDQSRSCTSRDVPKKLKLAWICRKSLYHTFDLTLGCDSYYYGTTFFTLTASGPQQTNQKTSNTIIDGIIVRFNETTLDCKALQQIHDTFTSLLKVYENEWQMTYQIADYVELKQNIIDTYSNFESRFDKEIIHDLVDLFIDA